MPADEVLDPDVVAGLRQAQDAFGNPEFINQLVGLFRANTPGKLDRIRQALAAGDASAVREAAHTLRTNCGMLGASRMADACARIEGAAARADSVGASAAFAEADAQLSSVLEALAALV